VLVLVFNLDSIASLGSAVALIVFTMITLAHFRLRAVTGASVVVLAVAVVSTLGTFLVFVTTTLVNEPVTAVTLIAIVALSVAVDLLWSRIRDGRAGGAHGAPTTSSTSPNTGWNTTTARWRGESARDDARPARPRMVGAYRLPIQLPDRLSPGRGVVDGAHRRSSGCVS
jgi:hypothetical protein